MDAKTKQNLYVEGNAARKLMAVPEREPRKRIERKEISRSTRRNREKALSIDFRFLVFLMAASVVTLYVCVGYLGVQSDITNNSKKIASLESQLNSLKDENDAALGRLSTTIDLEQIYKVAVEELGMVYAGKEQVRLYNSTESDYVIQYKDIPNIEKSSIIDMLLEK